MIDQLRTELATLLVMLATFIAWPREALLDWLGWV